MLQSEIRNFYKHLFSYNVSFAVIGDFSAHRDGLKLALSGPACLPAKHGGKLRHVRNLDDVLGFACVTRASEKS